MRSLGGIADSVDMQFYTERVEHNSKDDCPHTCDRCWYIGRSIDRESLQGSGIARLIEERIMSEIL
jgi:hypothetical protein